MADLEEKSGYRRIYNSSTQRCVPTISQYKEQAQPCQTLLLYRTTQLLTIDDLLLKSTAV